MQVASKRDMQNQVKLAHVDSKARRFDIELVRRMLFEKGLAITSVFIDRVLDATSGFWCADSGMCSSLPSSDYADFFFA